MALRQRSSGWWTTQELRNSNRLSSCRESSKLLPMWVFFMVQSDRAERIVIRRFKTGLSSAPS